MGLDRPVGGEVDGKVDGKKAELLRALALAGALASVTLPGCFNPEDAPGDTEAATSTETVGTTAGTTDTPTSGGTNPTSGTTPATGSATTMTTTTGPATDATTTDATDPDSSSSDAPPAMCGDGVVSAGNLCFDDVQEFSLQEFAIALELVDLNDDGNLDIGTLIPDDVQYLLGAGDGTFGVRVSGGTVESVTADFARVTPDGFPDVVYLSTFNAALGVAVGDGMSFTPAGEVPVAAEARQVQVTPFDDDERPDAIVVTTQGLQFFHNDTDGNLVPSGQQSASAVTDFDLGDINGDGRDDAVYVSRGNQPRVRAMFGGGSDGFSTFADLINLFDFGLGAPDLGQVTLGQLNDDTNADLALGNGDALLVAFGNGVAGFTDQVELECLSRPIALTTGDLDGDGIEDLVVGYDDSTAVSVFRARGDGTFEARVDFGVSTATGLLSTGDVNGDGVDDVLTADGNSSSTVTLLVSTP